MSNKYQHGSEFNLNRYTYNKQRKFSEYFLNENNPPKVKIFL
jgi:hypothetical protein